MVSYNKFKNIYFGLFFYMLFLCLFVFSGLTSANYININDLFFSGDLVNAQTYQADVNFKYNGNDFAGKLFFIEFTGNIEDVVLSGDTKSCRKQLRGFVRNSARGDKMWPMDIQTLSYFRNLDSSYNDLEITGGWFSNCDEDINHIYGSIIHTRNSVQYSMIAGADYDFINNTYNPDFFNNLYSEESFISGYYFDSYGGIGEIVGTGLLVCDETWVGDRSVVCTTNTLIQTNDCGQSQTVYGNMNCGGGGGGGITADYWTGQDNSGNYKVCSVLEDTIFSKELVEAFKRAYYLGITTMCPIENADLEGIVIRKHLAKMISNFTIKTFQTPINTGRNCSFSDMGDQTQEMKEYARLACQLGLMGMETDGVTPMNIFMPNDVVTRAQFGTILSRLLRGTKYAGGTPYYIKHLAALKKEKIMTKIDTPNDKELRGWVMLMLMRIVK